MRRVALALLILISPLPACSYNYQKAQTEADQQCADTLFFPLAQEKPSICGFKGYTAPTGNWHGGNDYFVPIGTKVGACDDGVIFKAVNGRGNTYPDIYDWGNVVMIKHKSGLMTVYGHLQRTTVEVGDYVRKGQVIGLSGNSGYSSGPHLHFEVRIWATEWSFGTPVDPYPNLWVSQNPIPSCKDAEIIRRTEAEIERFKKVVSENFPPEINIPNPFKRESFEVKSCNIPEGSNNVSCLPTIKLKFSQPVDLEDVANSVSITPRPIINYVIPSYLSADNKTEIRLTAFMLEANKEYQLEIRDLRSENRIQLDPWQRSFITGSWPHQPLPEPSSVMIHEPVIHLGNDKYDSPLNKGFTSSTSGTSWEKEFQLKWVPASTTLKLRIRGSEINNSLYLNGNQITLPINTEENNGDLSSYDKSVSNFLRVGKNIIRIESSQRISGNQDYDDFEVSEIQLTW